MQKRRILCLLLCLILVFTQGVNITAQNENSPQIKNIIYMIPDGGGMAPFFLADKIKQNGGISKEIYPNLTEVETGDDILYTEGLHVDDLSVSVLENKTNVRCDSYNLTDDYTKTAHLVVSYFKDEKLVECFVKEISFEDKLTFLNEYITRKTDDFDTVSAFVWSDIYDMTILGEYAVQ